MKKIAIIGLSHSNSIIAIEAITRIAQQSNIKIVVATQTESPFDKEPLRLIPLPILPTLKEMYDKDGNSFAELENQKIINSTQKIYISTYNDKNKHLYKKFHAKAKATNGNRSQRAKNKNGSRNPFFRSR